MTCRHGKSVDFAVRGTRTFGGTVDPGVAAAAAPGSNCASISSRFAAAQPNDSAICAKRPLDPDLRERHGAVALGQPRAVLVEHQRDVRVRRLR